MRFLLLAAALAIGSVAQASELWWLFADTASFGEEAARPPITVFANGLGRNDREHSADGQSLGTVGAIFGDLHNWRYGLYSSVSFFIEMCNAGRNLMDESYVAMASDLTQRQDEVTWEMLRKAYETGVYVSWLY